jgi:universal stress protein E
VSSIGGELHVLHSFDTAPLLAAASDTPTTTLSVPVNELTAGVEREHREALDTLLSGYPVDAAQVHLEEGVPHQVLVQTAQQHGIDIVVMGAVSRSGLRRIFVGSTAERALDRLPCDLVIVKRAGFEVPELD